MKEQTKQEQHIKCDSKIIVYGGGRAFGKRARQELQRELWRLTQELTLCPGARQESIEAACEQG